MNLMSLVAKYQREHVRGIAVVVGDKDAQRFPRCGCAARRYYTKWRFAGQEATYAFVRRSDSQRTGYTGRRVSRDTAVGFAQPTTKANYWWCLRCRLLRRESGEPPFRQAALHPTGFQALLA
jgi:hypothetical protein